jgi:hypothetical protein
VAFCVLGCFFGSGFEGFCGLRLLGWALVWLAVFCGLFVGLAGLLLFAAKLDATPLYFGTTRQTC